MNASIRTIACVCLASLALGGASGWYAGREVFPKRWNQKERYQQMLERFGRELKLTPEQKTQVGAILEAKRQKIEALRAEMRPRFQEIRRTTQLDIRRQLTPEQQPKFERMEAESQAHLKRIHPEWFR